MKRPSEPTSPLELQKAIDAAKGRPAMSNGRVTVYSPEFSVPGVILETELNTVKISYHPPGGSCTDWFHAVGTGSDRAGRRMGDPSDTATRYSISPAMPDEPTPDEAA